jgi:hypothetical protein
VARHLRAMRLPSGGCCEIEKPRTSQ